MSEYTYTVDVIGDDAVTDGLIMRTITELVDEHITSIADYAFYGCSALKTVICTNATGFRSDSFTGCTALETASWTDGSRRFADDSGARPKKLQAKSAKLARHGETDITAPIP